MVGDRVLVLNADSEKPNVLRLSAFDTLTGQMGLRSDPIVFPDWVHLSPGDDRTFGMLLRIYRGDLWLRWRARGRPRRKPPAAVHIDLKSGKVDMLAADKMPPPPPPTLALSPALTRLAQRDYETPAGPETNVLTAGNFAAALDVEKDGARRKVILHRWDAATEKEQEPVTLENGGRLQVLLFPTAGVTAIRPAPDPKRSAGAWRVFSLETGRLRASFPAEPGTLDAAVVGERFYYTYAGPPGPDLDPAEATPATRVVMLKAVDLTTARLAWWKPLDPSNPFWSFLYGDTPAGCPCDSGVGSDP